VALALPAVMGMTGCAAVFPEFATPLEPVPAGRAETEGPDDLLYLEVGSATMPPSAPDGRSWEKAGLPDPMVRVFIGDRLVIETERASGRVVTGFDVQQKGNYVVGPNASARVELWNQGFIEKRPVCMREVSSLRDDSALGYVDVWCENGARVRLLVEPARAKWGLGFRYELRNREAYVSAVYDYSPAARAGLKKGDRLMSIQGVDVATLDDEAVRSKVTVGARSKLVLQVLHPDRTPLALTIEPGPVYATWAEENPQAPQ